ncbi:unnamed protein product, partial [Gadus morhua 'NCC']
MELKCQRMPESLNPCDLYANHLRVDGVEWKSASSEQIPSDSITIIITIITTTIIITIITTIIIITIITTTIIITIITTIIIIIINTIIFFITFAPS